LSRGTARTIGRYSCRSDRGRFSNLEVWPWPDRPLDIARAELLRTALTFSLRRATSSTFAAHPARPSPGRGFVNPTGGGRAPATTKALNANSAGNVNSLKPAPIGHFIGFPRRAENGMSVECQICGGVRWVCENHRDKPWGDASDRRGACHCGSKLSCPACNPTQGQDPDMPRGYQPIIDQEGPRH
jgi:hypothetical protein